MLDSMERRTSEPGALADLFRLDHLTTRMRRHAEGLIILSGSTPARGWRNPVPIVDVLRAAVAEVEDYVRVDVLSESRDLLAGNAVNDVIHLFAELIENATAFSPPNTRIEVRADRVGTGLAAEIEDRGLGLADDELADINRRLASPAEFDLANSEQLGLFVVSRLAARHAITVTLRRSVYGVRRRSCCCHSVWSCGRKTPRPGRSRPQGCTRETTGRRPMTPRCPEPRRPGNRTRPDRSRSRVSGTPSRPERQCPRRGRADAATGCTRPRRGGERTTTCRRCLRTRRPRQAQRPGRPPR
jgi:signal transduction histidine kinase